MDAMQYTFDTMISVARRENNTRRGYLLVNRFQAKHIPVSPSLALGMFDALAAKVSADLAGKRVTFIGFAETATAIGARLAVQFGENACYLQTTRETLPREHAVADFEEEHSHATEQRLFCARKEQMLSRADRIVFVEDELTTGKTILNFVEALREKGYHNRFAAASLLNCMLPEHLKRFQSAGIDVYALLFPQIKPDPPELTEPGHAGREAAGAAPPVFSVPGRMEPRLGVEAAAYRDACDNLAEAAFRLARLTEEKRILVLGTEECMYPAIACAQYLEQRLPGASVFVHATTRSPILPCAAPEYPLFCRNEQESLYGAGRRTFVYNLRRYDAAVIVTDAPDINRTGLGELCAALRARGTGPVTVVRWAT